MTSSIWRAALERPRRARDEAGSLVLDILIGMAIFALVAIIAVSAVGQYRMRAYIQTAMSDAEATANAVNAAITDRASNPADGTYPTGLLTADDLDALEVTPTGRGANTSAVTVIPSPVNAERFTVCVEHRGAYAEYESDRGLVASGNIADDGFDGCDATLPDDGDDGDGGDPDTTVPTPTNVQVDVTGTDAVVTWDPVTGATSYDVHLDADAPISRADAQTTLTLTDLDTGNHSVTVTASIGSADSAPSAPTEFTVTTGPATTPADWTGYPDNLTGYGTQNANVPCPTLIGVESWHRWMGEYNYAVTFAQSPADFKATHTTTPGYRYKYRVITAATGAASSWQYNDVLNSHPLTPNQGWGIVPGRPAEGDVFYLEVIGQADYAGAYGAKCNTVGKFSVRYTPNWTPGVVQTIDNTPLDVSAFDPSPNGPVPCPVPIEAAYYRSLWDDHISFKVSNTTPNYRWMYRLEGGDWLGAGNNSTRGDGTYKSVTFGRGLPVGTTATIEVLMEDTTTGFRSDYCTTAFRVTKPSVGTFVYDASAVQLVTVDEFW